MTTVWIVVGAVGLLTMLIKAIGPVFLGGKPLPKLLAGVIELLAPALLAALVAINTFGVTSAAGGQSLTLDARVLGVAAAAIAIWRRAPLLLVVVVAAAVTALARALW